MFLQIVSGLNFLHTNDFPCLHRDIKPENILVNRKGRTTLSDFGLLKEVASADGVRLPRGTLCVPVFVGAWLCGSCLCILPFVAQWMWCILDLVCGASESCACGKSRSTMWLSCSGGTQPHVV